MNHTKRKLRMAMAGGGPGSFIGPVHAMAAALDGRIELIVGAFSSDPEKAAEAGRSYGILPERSYSSFAEMIAAERDRADRVDFVTIATPNHLHYAMTRDALEAGFNVLCDKPATATLEEADALVPLVRGADRHYAVSHTYLGYPMVRQARALCREGALGTIRKVVVEYQQGWLGRAIEHDGNKQASWRADPAQAGIGGCVADIGVHAFNLAEFVVGDRIESLIADLGTMVDARLLDDDCNILMRFEKGARGVLVASQIATGAMNALRLRIYGSAASLDWDQEQPNRLFVRRADQPDLIYHAASEYLAPAARAASRLPTGHPEGFIEAFANVYRDFADQLIGSEPAVPVQGISEAVRGMAFIATAVESSQTRQWLALPRSPIDGNV